jgi:hypothetical protein
MPKYLPFQVSPDIKASASDMIALHWQRGGVVADFVIPGNHHQVLRVQFDRADFIRVLDEMPLSTEAEETPNEGLAPEHFAYIVEGSRFWKTQSEAWHFQFPKARHYRFITGWACLDVIAICTPTITVEPSEAH